MNTRSRPIGRVTTFNCILHSQWSDAKYENGRWSLRGEWSMLKYDREQAISNARRKQIVSGKSFAAGES